MSSKLAQLTEAYSIDDIEKLLAERRQLATFDVDKTVVNMPDKLLQVVNHAHACEIDNTIPCIEEFYCDTMRAVYGVHYFDKLEALHGHDYHNGNLHLQTLKQVDESVAEWIQAEATEWCKTASGKMFRSNSSVARAAYMEALANKRGMTMYNAVVLAQ